MEARLEYVGLWLGLAKLGIATALINYNLRHETLANCINSSHSKALIYGAELADGESWYQCILVTQLKIRHKCVRFRLISKISADSAVNL